MASPASICLYSEPHIQPKWNAAGIHSAVRPFHQHKTLIDIIAFYCSAHLFVNRALRPLPCHCFSFTTFAMPPNFPPLPLTMLGNISFCKNILRDLFVFHIQWDTIVLRNVPAKLTDIFAFLFGSFVAPRRYHPTVRKLFQETKEFTFQ